MTPGSWKTPERRFPRWVFGVGEEPDVRFTLANERTFLAWCRTALAVTAAGIALEVLSPDVQPQLRAAAAILLVAGGTVIPPLSWFGWMRTERALRQARPLPPSILGVFLAILIAAVGVLMAFASVLR